MNTPRVSIIMPAYNDATHITQAIESIQSQSYGFWELIIIEDGSTDSTLEVITGMAAQDDRIRIIQHVGNKGLTASLNDGLNEAKAEFIARLDTDDYWSNSDKLQKQIDFLDSNPDHALVGAGGVAMDESGKELFPLNFPSGDEAIRKEILAHNCFIHSSVMFRLNAVKKLGGYKNTEKYAEDYELWLALGLQYKFAVLPIAAVNYRINATGLTQTRNTSQWQAAINLIKRYRRNYPGFLPAYLKLLVQKTVLQIFGTKFFNAFKTLLISK